MEHENNLYLIFVGLFLAVCIALGGGVWYSMSMLADYREEFDIMRNERENFSDNMEALKTKNQLLKRIAGVSFKNSGSASDAVEFYSSVRQAISDNQLEMISMSTGSSAFGTGENAAVLNIKLQGEYYALAHLLAAWRNLPFASRVTSLKLVRDQNNPGNFVDVDVTLEAWVGEQK